MMDIDKINAAPTKSFFVSMLTRDIRLEDAILDLLDNCIDGVNRLGKNDGPKPYGGFKADIKFDAESFSITDNCGGIPWNQRDYAFRMGRPSEAERVSGSVGVYGIGMKRAIFKMGKRCSISTRSKEDQYEIKITPEWLDNQDEWKIDVSNHKSGTNNVGTSILINDIHKNIAHMFGEDKESFSASLTSVISTHYAYIMDKGFSVTINDKPVEPKTINILYDKDTDKGIRPYIFEGEIEGVNVYLSVGLTRQISSRIEVDAEQEAPTRSSEDAGWTVLCNDRAVLYCDRTELTGWGEAGVPRYHTQFIAISGIVQFRSADPSRLPTTTTKRGLDASSPLYLQVKNKMREGMKIFTGYTNKWKSKAAESEKHTKKCTPLSLDSLKKETSSLSLTDVSRIQNAKQYKPNLPSPAEPESSKCRISFSKDAEEIKHVAEHLGNPNMDPNDVGEECFDMILEEVGR